MHLITELVRMAKHFGVVVQRAWLNLAIWSLEAYLKAFLLQMLYK